MLRICIAGLTDSGKTTVGNMLARDLNVTHVTKYITGTYKEFKEKEHEHSDDHRLVQVNKDKEAANSFDDEVRKLAGKGDCVVSTWFGPWSVEKPTLKVWLDAPFDERVKRCSVERKLGRKEAEDYVRKKDELTIKRLKEFYGVDIMDHSDFDAEINTSKFTEEEIVSIISMLATLKDKKRFR
jgi:CMP/dCMP kinase